MTTVTSDVVDGGVCQQRASSVRTPLLGFLKITLEPVLSCVVPVGHVLPPVMTTKLVSGAECGFANTVAALTINPTLARIASLIRVTSSSRGDGAGADSGGKVDERPRSLCPGSCGRASHTQTVGRCAIARAQRVL